MMVHTYERHCYTPDGRHLQETVTISGDDVACTLGGAGRFAKGDRAAFLELVNRWNRIGLCATVESSPLYLYIALDSVHG